MPINLGNSRSHSANDLPSPTNDLQGRLRDKVATYYARSPPNSSEVARLAARLLSHRWNEIEFRSLGDTALSERYYEALVAESGGYAALLMSEGFDLEEVEEMLNRVLAIAEAEFHD